MRRFQLLICLILSVLCFSISASAQELPPVIEYDLGETTIVQSRFPEDSRFHNMPIRLNGIIAVPEDDAPHPVVIILHGSHPGCPENESGVDVWPCAPEVEQPNYRGFGYLAGQLAAQGYVVLSININAENTFGFGEGDPGERVLQLLNLHLNALAEAADGGQNNFGVELAGRADLCRLAYFGHSRGGELAHRLINDSDWQLEYTASCETGERGDGLLLIAPMVLFIMPESSSAPMSIILPACDGDVITQDGQTFYETARLESDQQAWASSVWLEQANHNYFNHILSSDLFSQAHRIECETTLQPEQQRDFLVNYALDFLTTIFSEDSQAIADAASRMGMDISSPAVDSLYGLPARVAMMAARANRQPLLIPITEAGLYTNLLDGPITREGLAVAFCDQGFFTPQERPDMQACRRINLVIPGNPALILASWQQSGAALRFDLPDGRDLSAYSVVSLRAALDPLSELNPPGASQSFSIQLTDALGNTATVPTRSDEPALVFPPGEAQDDVFFGDLFTGRVPLTTIRLSLSAFSGIDLTDIREITLLFDQAGSGALFIADLEFVR
ncbi:MAG: hypothetical protein IAE89_08890 [Anaerolineae bacterium]|nr:hypothetical protein [Anaerolineae bacterium]